MANGLVTSTVVRSFMKPAKVRRSLMGSSDSELHRDRGLEGQQSAIARMAKFQLPCMQHVAGKAIAASIERIAENGTAEVLEVNADLVRAARTRTAFHEGDAPRRTEHAIFCHRLPPAADNANSHLFSIHGMASDWRVHDTAALSRSAGNQSQIDLAYFPSGELRGERAVGCIGLCHDKTAAGFFVKAVNYARTLDAADLRQAAKMVKQPRDERSTFVSRAGMNDHSRRLAKDSEEVVFKENFQRHFLGLSRFTSLRRRFAPENLITGTHDF